jgi:CheY-like chemotaxis protein
MDGLTMIQQIRQSLELKDVVIITSSASVFESDRHRRYLFIPSQKTRTRSLCDWLY